MRHRIDSLKAPLFISWQLTRDCNLACVHCCTDSAPGKHLADELSASAALELADQIIDLDVPYVMLCGGEPLVVPHFLSLAEALGRGGVQLKIETNGQQFDDRLARRLAQLPIRSIQISIDADTQDVYQRQRPGGSLERAHEACRQATESGLPLEITFAPTRLNIHHAAAVIHRARRLGAFRFNTGALMRIGTAARLWAKLEPTADQYREFKKVLTDESRKSGSTMELCFSPFDLQEGLSRSAIEPPATLLVLPNGNVKVAAALPLICADLRQSSLAQAWDSYREAWRSARVAEFLQTAIDDPTQHSKANNWRRMSLASA